MSVKIMIDSSSDFSEKKAKELGYIYMPISVQMEGEEYLDGVTLLADEFYERLEGCKEMPQTSLINEFCWQGAFEEATADGSEVVAITISSKLSGTYQAAVAAAANFGGRVQVVDSLNATSGEGILGLYALRLREQGLSAKEIADKLNEKKKDVCVCAVIDTLKYLKKGGRISAATAIIGTTLSVKPVIAVLDGEVKVIGKALGNKKGNTLLNGWIEKVGGLDMDMPHCYVWSGNDDKNIEKYRQDSAYLVQNRETEKCKLGCTIGAHIGSGAVGLVFFKKKGE